MIMLDFVKKSLRVSSAAFDDELSALIDEADEDLTRAGVENTETKLYKRAVVCYCRTYFGEREERERELMRQGYEIVKRRLAVTD